MTAEPKSITPKPPANLQLFVSVLGVEDAIRFLLKFGGAELYLTPTPKGRSELAQMFGVERASALAQAAEHMPRRVPTAKPWIAQVWKSQGLSHAEIARRLHVTDVTVRAFLKKAEYGDAPEPGDPRQMKLL